MTTTSRASTPYRGQPDTSKETGDENGRNPLAVVHNEVGLLVSWMLAGIYQVVALRGVLMFKGGTALKKCYFGDYRFSEDLDFTAIGSAPGGEKLLQG